MVLAVLVSLGLLRGTCLRQGTRLCLFMEGLDVTSSKLCTLERRRLRSRGGRGHVLNLRAKKQVSREANLEEGASHCPQVPLMDFAQAWGSFNF